MEWKPIEGYEGYYEVSDMGVVRSLDRVIVDKNGVSYRKRGRIMKQTRSKVRDNNGYLVVNLRRNHTSYVACVRKLVAMAFIPNPKNLPTVNHKNGDKTNNEASNLEWASYSENNKHALEFGLRKPRGNAVDQYSLDGVRLKRYPSGAVAARETGVSYGMISHCLNGYSAAAGGFVWKNVSEGQTTIPAGSTPEDELPAEAQKELGY